MIPTKEQVACALIIDGLRILAWQQFKATEHLKGLAGYEFFEDQWKREKIHKLSLDELKREIMEKYHYSEEELLKIRDDYYVKRSRYTSNNENSFDVLLAQGN